MRLHSYPWYTADWRDPGETRLTMTLAERGLYRELLDSCYQDGSLPPDERTLMLMAACTPAEWRRCWPRVSREFQVGEDGRLHHRKVDAILPELRALAEQRRSKARAGGVASWEQRRRLAPSSAPSSAPSEPQAVLGVNTALPCLAIASAIASERSACPPADTPNLLEVAHAVEEVLGYPVDLPMYERIIAELGRASLGEFRATLERVKGRTNGAGLLPLLARDAGRLHDAQAARAREMLESEGLGDADRAVIYEAFPELAPD